MAVERLSALVMLDLVEERLNNLSDLAIGEAFGGEIGDALAAQARANLAVLDELATKPTEPPLAEAQGGSNR